MKTFLKILNEGILDSNSVFYNFAFNELHNKDHITIYSDEPLGSNFSCFDFKNEGDDRDKRYESDRRFHWKDCKLTFDDDGVYWKSKSGKSGALLVYCIVKIEAKPKHIKIWLSPKDSGEDMGVIDFISD